MEDYIIGSTLSLFVLMTFYYLALRSTKVSFFKRCYLLISVVFSLVAPLITIHTAHVDAPSVEVIPVRSKLTQDSALLQAENYFLVEFDISVFVKVIYLIIALLLLIRFVYNFIQLRHNVNQNESIKNEDFTLVLTQQGSDSSPYSFGRYVFVDRDYYRSDNWDEQLLYHELVHVRQHHSWDLVLLELVSIFLWFQPLIYFYKKEIKFNHEILADEAVIKKYKDPISYQSLLYNMIDARSQYPLASALNYSLTKKRFEMIQKKYNRWRAYVCSILSIPLFVGLLLVVGRTSYAQSSPPKGSNTKKEIAEKDRVFKNATIAFETDNGIVYKDYVNLTPEEKANVILPPPPPPPPGKTYGADYPEVGHKALQKGDVVMIQKNGSIRLLSGDDLPTSPPPAPPEAPPAPSFDAPPPPAPPPPPKAPSFDAPAPPSPPAPNGAAAPPPPPPPPSSTEMLSFIKKKGGTVEYNGKEITTEKATELINKNNNLKISTTVKNGVMKMMIKD